GGGDGGGGSGRGRGGGGGGGGQRGGGEALNGGARPPLRGGEAVGADRRAGAELDRRARRLLPFHVGLRQGAGGAGGRVAGFAAPLRPLAHPPRGPDRPPPPPGLLRPPRLRPRPDDGRCDRSARRDPPDTPPPPRTRGAPHGRD